MYTKQWVIKGGRDNFFRSEPPMTPLTKTKKVVEGNKKGRLTYCNKLDNLHHQVRQLFYADELFRCSRAKPETQNTIGGPISTWIGPPIASAFTMVVF